MGRGAASDGKGKIEMLQMLSGPSLGRDGQDRVEHIVPKLGGDAKAELKV